MKCINFLSILLVVLILSSCKGDPDITAVNFVGNDIVNYQIGADDYQSYEIEVLYNDDSIEVLSLTDQMIKGYTIELFSSVGLKDIVIEYEGFESKVRFRVYETALDLELIEVFELALDAEVTTLTYSEWLESIKGEDGLGIGSMTIDSLGHLIITFTDNTTSDLGLVIGNDGANAGDGYYIVNFYSHSGFVISSQLVAEGNDAVGFTPDMPVGFVFDNWIGDYSAVTDHLDILPNYHKELYDINFIYDGVSAIADIEYGDTVVLPEPLKHGYVFKGWSLGNTSNSERVYDTTPIRSTMTLYPLWEEGIYSLNIGFVDDVFYGVKTRTFTGLLQTEIVPAKVGFVFAGWFLDASLDVAFNPTIMDPGSYDLYPRWFEADISFESGIIGGVETEYVNIVSYNGSENDVLVPENLYGYEVLSIGTEAFKDNPMWSIQLPANLALIGADAFSGCFNVEEIVFPASVEEIGTGALMDMTDLEMVTLQSAADIPDWFLAGSSELTSLVIPVGVESIGANALNGSGITSITIPSSVTNIGEYAFYGAYSLSSIAIPGNVLSIQNSTFEGTTILTDITLPDSVVTIESRAFANSGVTTINWPTSLEIIGREAFENSNIETAILNEGLDSIQNLAFHNASNLQTILIPSTVSDMGTEAFEGTSDLEILEVTSGNSFYLASENCLYDSQGVILMHCAGNMQTDTLTLLPTTGLIGSGSLVNSNISTLNIPETLQGSFPDNLRYLTNLLGVNVYENSGTTYYTLIDGVLFKDNETILVKFFDNGLVTSYDVPSTVTVIGGYAFDGASSIETLSLPSGLIYIKEGAFKDMINVSNFDIPISVGFIEDYAFYNCDSITSLDLSVNIDVLSSYAYAEMDSLTNFVINSSYIDYVADYFIYNSPLIVELAFDEPNFIDRKAFFGIGPATSISIQNGDYYVDPSGAIYRYCEYVPFHEFGYELTHYPGNIDVAVYIVSTYLFTYRVHSVSSLFGDNDSIVALNIGSYVWEIKGEVFYDTPNLINIFVSRGSTVYSFSIYHSIYNDNYSPIAAWHVHGSVYNDIINNGHIPDDIDIISD